MQSRALEIFYAKKTKRVADAVAAAALDMISEILKTPAPNRSDCKTLRSLIEALEGEKDVREVIKKIIAHMQKIENEADYQALYDILRDIETVFYQANKCGIPKVKPANLPGIRADYKRGDLFCISIETLLKAKGFSPDLFKHDKTLSIASDLKHHVAWAFTHIYSEPFPRLVNDFRHKVYIERAIHGIHHATLAALYAPVIANLFRRHGDADAIALTDEDLQYIQIALLLHDAAREDELEDRLDHESAMFIYLYLTRACKADKKKSHAIACAMANKDTRKEGLFEFEETNNGKNIEFRFAPTNAEQPNKSIQQKIIHDADCYDVVRTRSVFNAEYLDFFQCIVKNRDNTKALDEMAELIAEVGALLDIQGCSHKRIQTAIKIAYEQPHALDRITLDIKREQFPILALFGRRLLPVKDAVSTTLFTTQPYHPHAGITDDNIKAATREGLVFARGVGSPSAINLKNDETLAQHECRKTLREIGMETRSKKELRHNKFGNPARSVTRLGYRTRPFTNVGFLLIDPHVSTIKAAAAKNIKSGRGKKTAFIAHANRTIKSEEATAQDLAALHVKMKMGGDSVKSKKSQYTSNHTEVVCDIQKFDAIYISPDHTFYNLYTRDNPDAKHRCVPILQGIYLRDLYAKLLTEKRLEYIRRFGEEAGIKKFETRFGKITVLPIVEYSGARHFVRVIAEDELSNEAILQYWTVMCRDYLKSLEKNSTNVLCIDNLTVHDLKILAMHSGERRRHHRQHVPADVYYDAQLKQQLDNTLSTLLTNFRQRMHSQPQVMSALEYAKKPAAIHAAICFSMLTNNIKLVRAYLTNCREVFDLPSTSHENLLVMAIQSGSAEMVRLILKLHPDKARLIRQGKALHLAAKSGYLDVVDILIAAGASASWLDGDNHTALDVAIEHGHLKVVKKIFGSMQMLHPQTEEKPSPLFLAATHNQLEVAGYFCSQKIFSLSATDTAGMTMLHVCCQKGHEHMAQLLLDNGAMETLNAADKTGKTALMHAVISRQPALVKKLLENGADTTLKDGLGLTVIDHLQNIKANPSGLFKDADTKKYLEMETLFIQYKSSLKRLMA